MKASTEKCQTFRSSAVRIRTAFLILTNDAEFIIWTLVCWPSSGPPWGAVQYCSVCTVNRHKCSTTVVTTTVVRTSSVPLFVCMMLCIYIASSTCFCLSRRVTAVFCDEVDNLLPYIYLTDLNPEGYCIIATIIHNNNGQNYENKRIAILSKFRLVNGVVC